MQVSAGGVTVDCYTADVVTANDYYPGGQLMPGGQWGTAGRYLFNGKEQDPEAKGTGAQYDYGFRIYDPRLGRFLSVDPLTKEYPWYTPYQFAGNMPIWAVDLDGLEEKKSTSFSDIQSQTFIRMGQEWQIKSKIANEIYVAINQKIRSREGDFRFRTSDEEGVIKGEIMKYIVVGLDDNRAAIKHPETNEPSIIYKFAKTTFSFLTNEALPVTLSAGGKGTFEVGSLLTRVSANVESYQTNFYKKYFPEKYAKATAINTTTLKAGGTLAKGFGTVLKVSGKLLNIAGIVTIMYDVISAGSPKYVEDEDFQKWTREEIKKYLDLQANQSSSGTTTTATTSQTTTSTTSNTGTVGTDKKN
jgi:RHS repeat-associated protein